MGPLQVDGATGDEQTNYQAKANACLEALKENDLVVVHVKAADRAGHKGDWKEKIKAIEARRKAVSWI